MAVPAQHLIHFAGYEVDLRSGEVCRQGQKVRLQEQPFQLLAVLGKELYFGRRYDEAMVEFRRALELDPTFVSARNWLSDTFLEKGMYQEAMAELKTTRPFKEDRVYIRQTAYLYARMGRRSQAERALEKSLQLSKGKHVSAGAVSLVYAMLGNKDKSFFWLERAYEEKSSFMTSLKFWPAFDEMRADPRFINLLRNVGVPE